MDDAFSTGFRVAAAEIRDGVASHVAAKERDIYPTNQSDRIDWDAGYEAAICAYRLGHDVESMVEIECFACSLLDPTAVILSLLDGQWELGKIRPDPRAHELSTPRR